MAAATGDREALSISTSAPHWLHDLTGADPYGARGSDHASGSHRERPTKALVRTVKPNEGAIPMITPTTSATAEADRSRREYLSGPAYFLGVPNWMWRQALRRRRQPTTDT